MAAYDNQFFDPPAPLARVQLRNSETRETLFDIPMLLDSGADVTLIPRASIDKLDIVILQDEAYELMGFDGSRSFASVAYLEMLFLGRIFRGRYLLIDQEWGIMGRDVLNSVSLLFDGPKLSWEEKA